MALGTFKLGVEDASISPQTLGHSLEEFPLYVEGEYISLSLELSKGGGRTPKLPFEGPVHGCFKFYKRGEKKERE